jgi:hypothetical protein
VSIKSTSTADPDRDIANHSTTGDEAQSSRSQCVELSGGSSTGLVVGCTLLTCRTFLTQLLSVIE